MRMVPHRVKVPSGGSERNTRTSATGPVHTEIGAYVEVAQEDNVAAHSKTAMRGRRPLVVSFTSYPVGREGCWLP